MGARGPGRDGPVGFDLDLTLIDSRPAIMAAWTALAAETGASIDLAAVDRRMGSKLEDEAAYWFPPAEVEAATAGYRRHYLRVAPSLTTALPGAGEAIAAVRAAGQRAVIITAKHPVSVGPSLQAAGLSADQVYAHVYGPEKAAVLARIGAVAYVGDAAADMQAGLAAGVRAVGVPTGSFTRNELLEAGAQAVLDSLAQFPDWYAGLRTGPARRGG
ncbi:MAG TPA: HAD family hydrolase [Streptosporangiaceae bacterium]|nr:HAD family hydrolase [Streptosporangiaceae bacterium]